MSFGEDVAIRTLWGEARGEPDDGIVAVAHVILNRLATGQWGSTIQRVCMDPDQFCCWNQTDPNFLKILDLEDTDPELNKMRALFNLALHGPDPTKGACFYFADTMTSPPSWAASMTQTAHIGHHIFFRDGP